MRPCLYTAAAAALTSTGLGSVRACTQQQHSPCRDQAASVPVHSSSTHLAGTWQRPCLYTAAAAAHTLPELSSVRDCTQQQRRSHCRGWAAHVPAYSIIAHLAGTWQNPCLHTTAAALTLPGLCSVPAHSSSSAHLAGAWQRPCLYTVAVALILPGPGSVRACTRQQRQSLCRGLGSVRACKQQQRHSPCWDWAASVPAHSSSGTHLAGAGKRRSDPRHSVALQDGHGLNAARCTHTTPHPGAHGRAHRLLETRGTLTCGAQRRP